MAAASKKRAKKRTRKKNPTGRKGKVTKVIHESTKEIKVDKVLVDNFVALQKIMVHMSSKFDNLSTQISKLLDLFDISAKALAKKDFDTARELEGTEEIMKRLDDISRQAGLIGRGLELIHKVNQERGGRERMTQEEEEEQPRLQHSIMHPQMQKPVPQHVPQPMAVQRPMQPQVQRPMPQATRPIQSTTTRPPLAPPRTPPIRPQNNQNQTQAP